MNRVTALSAALLGLSSLLLAGCDSSYHPYNGQSGFSFEPEGTAQYTLHYQGLATSRAEDLNVMWHHTARELCRGGAYHHSLHPLQDAKLSGRLHCLTPGLGLNRQVQESDQLLAEHQLPQPELPCTQGCRGM
ncbi:hypothetical protein [Neptuniibacter halophilus]|uniref:hypothetical protein n=1 Tax=Neptuniibacter halophilus TaxID=651666 RepID=UPI002573A270|nr:hypothetical protein [Neptuniibacter halophilus]